VKGKCANHLATEAPCQGYEVRSNDIRSQLKWKTLSQIRNSHKLMMYKILNNMSPVYLRDHFKMSFTDQAYSLRNRKLCLILPRAQTEFLKKSFAFSGTKVWNELPEEVKCSNSLQIFKKCISSHA
jgi:hypothetical protein